ncbi:hypothetical protein OG195_41865 [Streptomyces sp. NBC_01362]|uniref:hypothetical protein n=1 Tax=Streptomyces sp. NBC_01362 TaxID=2903839 RepID=UPI002E35B5F8|nr:hypothetical protein [Streptomyces sp. NBC_01362]
MHEDDLDPMTDHDVVAELVFNQNLAERAGRPPAQGASGSVTTNPLPVHRTGSPGTLRTSWP